LKEGAKRITVIQGEYEISSDPEMVLTTVLGSCIAVCAYDPLAGIGGMNHFLLPEKGEQDGGRRNTIFGSYLMELLLNELYKNGARRERLQIKLFGGACMLNSCFDTGERNAEFILRFLADEKLPVMASSLGGLRGRRIEFFPVSGRSRQKFMAETKEDFVPPPATVTRPGEVELF